MSFLRKFQIWKVFFSLLKRSTDDENVVYWVSKVRKVFLMKWEGDASETEHELIKYMVISKGVDSVVDFHECLCLRWRTDEEILQKCFDENKEGIAPYAWFGLEQLPAIKFVVHVV